MVASVNEATIFFEVCVEEDRTQIHLSGISFANFFF